MKKSLIGLGVIAAMAVGGAANAGTFSITGGQVFGLNPGTFTGTMTAGDGGSVGLDLGALSGAGLQGFAAGTAATVRTNLGLDGASNNGSLTYFSLAHNGKGYFGIMFIGNANNFYLTVENAVPPSVGVYRETPTSSTESLSSGTYNYSATLGNNMGVGVAYLWLFTQIPDMGALGGDASAQDGNFTIRYMTYTGSGWGVVTGGEFTGASGSLLNVATFIVPVPAPALLAGLGLAGALALRRRMK